MKYSSIKILEGINCSGIKSVISIICKKQYEKELIKKLKDYEIICGKLRLGGEFVEIIHKDEVVEGYVTYKSKRTSKDIIEELLNETDMNEILLKYKDDENYVCELELINLCDKYKVPVMYIGKNEFQIGYGVNLKKINIEEWKDKKDIIINEFENEKNWNIPIISITGTNGKTTTARLIHNTLLDLGFKCGMASTGGIYIEDKVIKHGDTTGFYSAREVLKNQNLDVAVLETARGGMLKKGLGYEQGSVAIITSISEDHIGMSGIKDIEDLVSVKSLIVDGLGENGVLVIKAIDILFKRFKDRKNLIVFDYEKNEVIESHINNGGKAYYISNEYIVENNKGLEEKLVRISELPFGFYGVSKSNIKNIIAALAAINVLHENKNEIIEALKKRECNINTNLGRQNIIDFNKFKLIIDYGHNSEAFKEVFSIARALKPSKITAVITAAGDRSDKYIKELGEITAEYADKIIIKEQPDLRGRKIGETAKLLKEGAISEGFSESYIKVCLEEEEAIKTVLNEAVEGEVIVSFSQFLYLTFPVINDFRKINGLIAVGEDLDLAH